MHAEFLFRVGAVLLGEVDRYLIVAVTEIGEEDRLRALDKRLSGC